MKLAARFPALAVLALVGLSFGCDDESPGGEPADAAVDSSVDHVLPGPDGGLVDAGPSDAGHDAASGDDAGDAASDPDAGVDAGHDAGEPASDPDAGEDAGHDAGEDAGAPTGDLDAGDAASEPDTGVDAGCPGCFPVLGGLSVDRGTLSPAFDPAVTEYQLHLKLWEDHVGVAATADDGFAVFGAGEVALSPGTNVVDITVSSAEAELTYTIRIERGVGLEHYIKASNAQAGDEFADSALAISADGNTMVVGASREDSSTSGVNPVPDELLTNAGAVYVLTRNPDGSWTETDFIKAFNPGAEDRFSLFALALSGDGNTLAVGAAGEDSSTPGPVSNLDELVTDELLEDSGAVYVYTRGEDGWQPEAFIKPHDQTKRDAFGYAVALSYDGDTLAVGAFKEDSSTTGVDSLPDEAASSSGAAYVFTRSAGNWTQEAYLKAHQVSRNDSFGLTVALDGSGDVLAVGAHNEDSASTGVNSVANEAASDTGAAYVFRRADEVWSQEAYIKPDISSAGDNFGERLSLSSDGTTLAVGSPHESSNTSGVNTTPNERARWAGAAYVFEHGPGGWEQRAYLKPSNVGRSDRFGDGLALNADGSVLAVCATYESSANGDPSDDTAFNSGAAYVFTREAEDWAEQAYLKAPQVTIDDEFGTALAISADGRTLLIGTPFEDSSSSSDQAPDEDAIDSGAVWVF